MSAIATLRREMARGFALAAARRGYVRVGSHDSDFDHEFAPILAACREYTMTSPERMYAVYVAVRHAVAAGVPGDFAECGVWRGGCAMVAAMTLQLCGDDTRCVHLYDTFSGMTEPGEHEGEHAIAKWRRSQRDGHNEWCYAGLGEVLANMERTGFPMERVRAVEGRVEDTLPGQAPGELAVLRLDTDWYESTHHELVHLYPLLSPGGVLLLDDYGHWTGHREAVDDYFRARGEHLLLTRVDPSGRMAVKPATDGFAAGARSPSPEGA